MPKQRRRSPRISEAAEAWLKRQLKDVWGATYAAHEARRGRIVVSYCLGDHPSRDAMPPGPVPLEDLRLLALSYRWGAGSRGEPRPRAPLVLYRAIADLPGTGRVRFVPTQAWDAACPRLAAESPHAASAALRLHSVAEDALAADWTTEFLPPRFDFAFDAAPPSMDSTSSIAAGRRIEGLLAWPQDLFLGPIFGGDAPEDRGLSGVAPTAVYADLSHLRGDPRRNPAFSALVRHGLIPRDTAQEPWSSRLQAQAEQEIESAEISRFRSRLEAYASADPSHKAALHQDLAASFEAAGLPLPGGPWGEAATASLLSPWEPVGSNPTFSAQTISWDDHPGTPSAVFSGPSAEVDLGTLDGLGPRFAPVPRRSVAAALVGRRRGR